MNKYNLQSRGKWEEGETMTEKPLVVNKAALLNVKRASCGHRYKIVFKAFPGMQSNLRFYTLLFSSFAWKAGSSHWGSGPTDVSFTVRCVFINCTIPFFEIENTGHPFLGFLPACFECLRPRNRSRCNLSRVNGFGLDYLFYVYKMFLMKRRL